MSLDVENIFDKIYYPFFIKKSHGKLGIHRDIINLIKILQRL